MERFPRLTFDNATPEQAEILRRGRPGADGGINSWCATLAHNPALAVRWLDFGEHMLYASALPGRDREVLTLRTARNCDGAYPWSSHVRHGQQEGLTIADIESIAAGPDAPGLDPWDRWLVRAADDLHQQQRVGDETFAALRERYSLAQVIEACAVVGRYTMTCYVLNTADVGPDGVELGAAR